MKEIKKSSRSLFGAIAVSLLVSAPTLVCAESWTSPVAITSVQPLATLYGGMLRVILATPITTALCGTTTYADLMYNTGTPESRAPVISAIYMALATDRPIELFISDTSCSVSGQILFTGVNVPR